MSSDWDLDDDYPCVGICQMGTDGYCRGCGRPMTPPVRAEDLAAAVEGSIATGTQGIATTISGSDPSGKAPPDGAG